MTISLKKIKANIAGISGSSSKLHPGPDLVNTNTNTNTSANANTNTNANANALPNPSPKIFRLAI